MCITLPLEMSLVILLDINRMTRRGQFLDGLTPNLSNEALNKTTKVWEPPVSPTEAQIPREFLTGCSKQYSGYRL